MNMVEFSWDGNTLIVKPSIGVSETKIIMMEEDVKAFEEWQNGKLIQNAFPDWPAEKREILLMGMSSTEWDDMFKEDELDMSAQLVLDAAARQPLIDKADEYTQNKMKDTIEWYVDQMEGFEFSLIAVQLDGMVFRRVIDDKDFDFATWEHMIESFSKSNL